MTLSLQPISNLSLTLQPVWDSDLTRSPLLVRAGVTCNPPGSQGQWVRGLSVVLATVVAVLRKIV